MIPIDEVVYFDCVTSTPATSAAVDADSAPTFDVFEEATDTPILDDQTMTKRTSLTGNYRGTFTASAANGFEAGKWYNVVVSGIVGGVTGKCVAMRFRVAPAETVAGRPEVTTAANSDKTGYTLTSGPLDAAGVRSAVGLASANLDTQLGDLPTASENATALLDLAAGVETGLTLRQALRLMVAADAGKLSGAATTTIVIRNAVADSKNRITATVDTDGNRSAITYDLT